LLSQTRRASLTIGLTFERRLWRICAVNGGLFAARDKQKSEIRGKHSSNLLRSNSRASLIRRPLTVIYRNAGYVARLGCYPGAIEDAFGIDVTYGQIEKHYGVQAGIVEAARRVVGRPHHISTSYAERQNLTLRMQQRRFTRLTNAFSKKLENHMVAVALYAAAFNFCRVHETLRVTPAMQLGVTDHIWSIGELVDAAALSNEAPKPAGRKFGPFRIIEGDRK
jgi:hypothetical protein